MLKPFIDFGDNRVITPFGPSIGKAVLSQKMIDYLLDKLKKHDESDDFQIVGMKPEGEARLSEEDANKITDEIEDDIKYFARESFKRGVCGNWKMINAPLSIKNYNCWYADMGENDYLPPHHHGSPDKGAIACFGFLKVPEHFPKSGDEITNRYLDGSVNFSFGEWRPNSCYTFSIRPKVGDVYIFNEYLVHQVFPFRGAGRRVSFSLNLDVIMEQEVNDSNQ
jgi:hypothetical protein